MLRDPCFGWSVGFAISDDDKGCGAAFSAEGVEDGDTRAFSAFDLTTGFGSDSGAGFFAGIDIPGMDSSIFIPGMELSMLCANAGDVHKSGTTVRKRDSFMMRLHRAGAH